MTKSRRRGGARYARVHRKKWQSDWNWHPKRPLGETIVGLFAKKRFVLGITILAIILGGIVLEQGPLFHSTEPNPNYANPDPQQLLWDATSPNTDTSEFHVVNTVEATLTVNGYNSKALKLTPNATQSAAALSLNPIDIGTVNGKNLLVGFGWATPPSASGTTNVRYGMFLRTNGTIPTELGYNPLSDKQVVMILEHHTSGVGLIATSLWMQRDPTITLANGEPGNCPGSGTCFFSANFATANIHPDINLIQDQASLNFTGTSPGALACTGTTGNACSSYLVNDFQSTNQIVLQSTRQPWLSTTQNYYVGFFAQANLGISVYFTFDLSNGSMSLWRSVIPPGACTASSPCPQAAPTVDTGGFFGPVIRALISIGVFVLNAILGFIGFVAPAIQTALTFLEGIIQAILNLIGNALGFGNVGTTLFSLLGSIVTFFTNNSYGFPAFFGFFGVYITNFLRYLQIDFQFLNPVFTIANAILIFGVNGVAEAFTIFLQGVNMMFFGYGTFIVFAYFLYVGDDGIGGLFTFLGTLEAISFKILNSIVTVTNVGLDFLVTMVSLVPKPLIQMSAARIPRLPTVEYAASMSFPSLDFGEARNGNLIVYWLWCMGLWFMLWFETQNPALPGSLVAIDPAIATNIRNLAALIPLMQAATLISGGLVLAWFAMLPMRLAGIDVTESPLGASLGRRSGSGPTGVSLASGKKHVIGPAKKAAKEQARRKGEESKAESDIEKHKKKLEREKQAEELRKREIARKPTGKDLKGPNLGPLGPE